MGAETKVSADRALKAALERTKREAVEKVLAQVNGNVAEAAAILGIVRPSLYRIMKRYGIAASTQTQTQTQTETPTEASTQTQIPTQTETETEAPTETQTQTETPTEAEQAPTQTETETEAPTQTKD